MWAADPSALIAELLFTSAYHCWASFATLHPELAFGALLEFSPSCEVHKGLILRVQSLVAPILFATHISVVHAPTFETVVLVAAPTVEFRNAGVILENKLAIWSWAPTSISAILLDVPIHLIAVIFLLQFRGAKVEQLLIAHFDAAPFIGAVDDVLSILYHVFGVLMEAVDVEGMLALKVCYILY